MTGWHVRFLCAALLAVGMLPAQTTAPARPNPYVDAKVCATCHAKIAESYAQTGMGRSFSRPQAVADVTYHHEASDTWYAMSTHDGALYQRRWRIGYDGKPIDQQELRIDYVMGSGNHARTYLHRTQRDTLLELPLAWYSENGGEWAISPGQDRAYSLAPRTIAYECMFCHNAYPRVPAAPASADLYLGDLPGGIDCQRCHGPGAEHVRTAQSGSAPEAIRKAIVNPARLNPDRQMEVCMQCHLETTSRPLPHSIVKYNREPFSYKPGEPLGDFEVFFDRAPGAGQPSDNFEIAHTAYRFRKSKCFLESAGKLTCITCHNPHQAAALPVKAVCQSCHAAAHHAESNCVDCHMPKRRTEDVVHVVMTDHWIQRAPAPHDPRLPIAESPDVDKPYRGPIAQYYPAAPAPLYLAVAQAKPDRLAAEIAAQKPSNAQFYIELGQAYWTAGQRPNALAAFQEAVRRKPDSAPAALSLADAWTQSHQPERAVNVLTRALSLAAADPLLWYQLGIAQAAIGKGDEAIASYRKSVVLDPDSTEAHNLLGAALASAGDLDAAEVELRRALAINPDYPDALGNLGHLLAARNLLPEAAFFLARAVKIKPNDAEIRTNYAVTLAGLRRFDDGMREIAAAISADPKSAEAHNFRGLLLDQSGDRAAAIAEYLKAVQLQPDFARAHFNAGRALAATGNRAAAIDHLRRAATSDDPALARQAADALRALGVTKN